MQLTKTILTALILVSLLMMPRAKLASPWPHAVQAQTPQNCLRFGDCQVITCNPNGSYTYTFQVTNLSAITATEAEFQLINPANAVITPNPYPLSPPLLPTQSTQITVTVSGVGPVTLCFALTLHDKKKLNCCSEVNKCVILPPCGATTEPSVCTDGICCSRAPQYNHTGFTGQKVAAVTGWSLNDVLTVFDLSGANGFTLGGSSTPNNTPVKYNGPSSSRWTLANLGSIFGVTIDHQGNIYVTASSAYNGADFYPQGAGRIYKLANGTGAISNFNPVALPNSPDPSISPASQSFPALGNISFDCAHKQFFVTNEEDGRIYRLDHANGSVVGTFDHMTGIITNNGNPEFGDQLGFAPLGERLWGVQVHNSRVYYSVWKEDCGNQNSNPAVKNEIWSVGINVSGDFIPGDKRIELTVPDLPGANFSNPTSDISFSRDGKMLLAERTMGCDATGCGNSATVPNAHASRVLEYNCTPTGWTLVSPISGLPYKYNIGLGGPVAQCPIPSAAQPANAAGGIDYDYDPSATFRMWTTGDILLSSPLIYGLQGVPLAGGSINNSVLIALYGIGSFKTQIGDVEVSCPPGSSPY